MEIICKDVKKSIKIKDGFLSYKTIDVLKDINYVIKQGEIIAIMGAASSGKSTLINVLSGKDKVSSGKIYVDGESSIKRLQEISEVINSFQVNKLNSNESVYNNLVEFGKKIKIDEYDIEKKIVDLKNVLDFEKVINKKISELDDVYKIKVNIAISMLKNPSVLYFDNALIGLDSITKNTILKLLKRVNKEFKTTIVVASIDLMDVEKICKRVSVIQNGKIVIDGDFESVKEKYWSEKLVAITFNKSFNIPKGNFEIIEMSDYFLKVKINFSKCDFSLFINQFDINTIIDINISSLPLVEV